MPALLSRFEDVLSPFLSLAPDQSPDLSSSPFLLLTLLYVHGVVLKEIEDFLLR